jgi:hypothetical protein
VTITAGQTITVTHAVKNGDTFESHGNTFQPWEVNIEGEGNTTYKINTKVGNDLIAPKTGLVKSVIPHDTYPTRLQMDWNPEKSGSHSGSGSSGGHEYQRSKEQCMRGEAAQAAATVASNMDDLFVKAEAIYKWIVGDEANAPTPAAAPAPDFEAQRKALAAWGQQESVPPSDIAAAIKELTGRDKLEPGDDFEAIKAKAKALTDDQIPF